MQVMPGITAVAGRWTLSAGTVLAVGGGLALYQMTSLVLGPAGSRELHVSLIIPAVDVKEPAAPLTTATLLLGTLAVTSTPSVSARPTVRHRAAGAPASSHRAAPLPTPGAKIPAVVPVTPIASAPPAIHPSDRPVPPTAGLPDRESSPSQLHDDDD
jgi:hypothetical protein